jgi:hypothetical protein
MVMKLYGNMIAALIMCAVPAQTWKAEAQEPPAERAMVQARIVLTVAEGKRLIAKAVAQMPEVRRAREKGTLIITKGTTNTYVAEEITGETIRHGAFVYGRVYPSKGGTPLSETEPVGEIVYVKGERRRDLSLQEAVAGLQPGDVVIKGGNALDYANRTAGVYIGSATGGTTGTIMPYLVARKAQLIIPIGLEKQCALPVLDIQLMMRTPMESLNSIPSMFLLTGTIVTEIEAFKILSSVSAFQTGAGGIGGAEGAVHFLVRGSREQVQEALRVAASVEGEPAFVK